MSYHGASRVMSIDALSWRLEVSTRHSMEAVERSCGSITHKRCNMEHKENEIVKFRVMGDRRKGEEIYLHEKLSTSCIIHVDEIDVP
ncbi:hypothetical protein Tco_0972340 [Tanacetum coccineum]